MAAGSMSVGSWQHECRHSSDMLLHASAWQCLACLCRLPHQLFQLLVPLWCNVGHLVLAHQAIMMTLPMDAWVHGCCALYKDAAGPRAEPLVPDSEHTHNSQSACHAQAGITCAACKPEQVRAAYPDWPGAEGLRRHSHSLPPAAAALQPVPRDQARLRGHTAG